MVWLFLSCLVGSDQEFAVIDQGVESVCERFQDANNCVPQQEEEFEPIPQGDDPEDFEPKIRVVIRTCVFAKYSQLLRR